MDRHPYGWRFFALKGVIYNLKEPVVVTTFPCTVKMDAMVDRIAAAQGVPKSKVLRDLLEAGLQAKGYLNGGESMADLVQHAVDASLKPQVERLAAISAKAAHISAASFFMNYSVLRQFMPEDFLPQFDEAAAKARKLGSEYLRLNKNRDIDQFLSRGLAAMAREDDT